MSQPFRLPEGGSIDRDRPLRFRFNGRWLDGFDGDTLASALLANGIRTVARSFRFHRPRGIITAGEEEPGALLEVGEGARRVPSCRAPQIPLAEGLVARSQSGWPGLACDLGRVLDLTHPLWPAGFYNKTFKWPSWRFWEGMIRHLSGLGRAPDAPDPDRYEQVNAHCDLLVCGGGPAGLMAALVAGRAGARVVLADQDRQFGGCLNWERVELDGRPAGEWVGEVVRELETLPGVVLLPDTTVAGIYDHNVTTLTQRGSGADWRECFWTVRPRQILLASGALEQGMIFPGNDRPGIMLAGAVRHYLNRYAVAAGRAAVVATNNDSAYQTVRDLCLRGIPVAAVADLRPEVRADIRAELDSLNVPLFTAARVGATRGGRALREVVLERQDGRALGRYRCDLLGVSGGWAARLHLFCHARGRLRFDPAAQSFLPADMPRGLAVTGSAGGTWGLAEVLAGAEATARSLCERLELSAHHAHRPALTRAAHEPGVTLNLPPRRQRRRQWIDLAHDVTLADAELAVREGFESVEHFKRYTTTGMSVDQGKTGNLNALFALSALTGRPIGEIGTTTFRPPYAPVTLGAVAGHRRGDFHAPRRLLPAHRMHESRGAHFEDYGGWHRPEYYGDTGGRTAAIRREVLAVRQAVGVFDNSPLGKIEVRGPDAARFLHRFYINPVRGLAVGHCRYGLMLNENGVIIDDGVFSRLADDHFLVNTTSGGVGRVLAVLEAWLQCEWPDLRVLLTDTTAQWANFTVAGPRARDLLRTLDTDIDLDSAALPHMGITSGHWRQVPVRIARVSFSGESSFEFNLPARLAGDFLAGLLAAGEPFGITPYGIEALMTLRLEKGYLHVGADTDGQTTPDDVGWGRVARGKAEDYIGRRSLFRPANQDPNRKQLVGIVAADSRREIRAGSHLLLGAGRRAPARTDGWITSAAWSPTLERFIALGMLRGGRSLPGAALTVIDEKQRYPARVVATPFYDPANGRLQS